MSILPLKSITPEDKDQFPESLINLAKLARCEVGVLPGWVVASREFLGEELKKEFKGGKFFILQSKLYKKIDPLLEELSKMSLPEVIFLAPHDGEFGEAYFDTELKEVVVKSVSKLTPEILRKIDRLVIEANKKLFIPQRYKIFTAKESVALVGLSDYSGPDVIHKEKFQLIASEHPKAESIKSAVKVFLNLSKGFTIVENCGGVLIEAEKVQGLDETALKLVETATTFHNKAIIFRLPFIEDEVRGTLLLLKNKKLLDEAVEAFLFARHKKSLLNLEIALPLTRSAPEFIELKKELAARGIVRKGALKIWLEFAIAENLINLDEYLVAGLDGIILNLDELQKNILGINSFEKEFYQAQVSNLVKVLPGLFAATHKAKIPVIAKGEVTFHPDILEFLIEKGIYGVVANNLIEAESAPEHLNWMEKRIITKHFLV